MKRLEFQSLFDAPVRNGIYKSKDFQGRGVRLVKMNQLFSERRLRSQADGYELIELSEKERQVLLLKKNDLLFSRTSVVADGVGKCSIILETDEELTWDSNIIRVRINSDLACPQFYFYFFNSIEGRDVVKRLSSGAAVTTITGTGLAASCVPIPPLPVQRRVAEVLTAYDDLIENNARRIKILEDITQALYREWFVHFRFPGHEKIGLVDSPLGTTPKAWEMKKLGSLAQEVRRSVRPGDIDPETPYFGLEHLPRKSIALSDWGTAKQVQSTKLSFEKGEILFGKIRPYFHKVGVAPISGVCSSDTIVIRPTAPEHFAIVLGCVSSEEFVAHATQTSQGTKMPRANWNVLRNYPVPMPAPPVLEKFNDLVRDSVAEIQNLILKTRNLRRARDLLLPKLISGEINLT